MRKIKKHEWLEVRGQKFTSEEARGASDFGEIVREYGLTIGQAVEWFSAENLSVGRRLYLVETCPKEKLLSLVFDIETDDRIAAIVQDRLYVKEGVILV